MRVFGLMIGDMPSSEGPGPGETVQRQTASASSHRDQQQAEMREVAMAKAGDPELWDKWFQEFYPRLFRYAYIRLRNRGEAEDIASQVFVEALRGHGRGYKGHLPGARAPLDRVTPKRARIRLGDPRRSPARIGSG